MSSKILAVVFIFWGGTAQTQNRSDSAFSRQILDSTITFYTQNLGGDLLLYNGREYTGNYSRTIGHPFYASDRPQKGSIVYDRIAYPHPAISYDLTSDEVFIKTTQDVSVKLAKEKVDRFSLDGHLFVRLSPRRDKRDQPGDGFYEVLFDDSVTVLAKRRKQLEPTFNLEDPYRFVQYDRYFIRINDVVREVQNEGSLFSLFPGHQKEIRRYVRNKGVSFKKNRENFIVQVARYYSQIKK